MTVGNELLRDLKTLFLPRGCLGCGERIPPEEGSSLVCFRCRSRLRPPSPPTCLRCQNPLGTGSTPGEPCLECADWPQVLRSARAAVTLDTTAGGLLHALKYRGWDGLATFMARRMASEPVRHLHKPLLVPVPTTSWRHRTRGYNQAELLARALAREWSLPILTVLRRRAGRTQVRLSPRERKENVRGSFSYLEDHGSPIRGREVILIDDVLTTGATALSAVQALESGGPAGIHLRTFARALPFSSRE